MLIRSWSLQSTVDQRHLCSMSPICVGSLSRYLNLVCNISSAFQFGMSLISLLLDKVAGWYVLVMSKSETKFA